MPHSKAHNLVVLGADRVGKTAIIEQLIFGNHVIGQEGLPTIGDIYDVCVETDKGVNERLHVFDTPGALFSTGKEKETHHDQDHFLSIADGFILVYEVPSKASYDLVVSLRQRIVFKNKDLPIVVLGNKRDLNAIREVDFTAVQHWVRANGMRAFEVSVMDRDSLKEPFSYIAWRMANPGRLFSQLPSLTGASVPMKSSQDRLTSERLLSATPSSSEKSLDSEFTEPDPTKTGAKPHQDKVKSLPEDAKFPKHFLTDCLHSQHKFKEDQ